MLNCVACVCLMYSVSTSRVLKQSVCCADNVKKIVLTFFVSVKDLIPLGSHRHQGPVSKPVTHQEICMKPIQPSNHRPSYPPLRQALTLKRSDMDHRGKRASTYHPNSPGVPRGTPGSLTNSHSQVRKVQSAPISLNQSKDIRCNFGPGIGNPLSPPSNKSETPPLCKPSTPGSTSEEDSHKVWL